MTPRDQVYDFDETPLQQREQASEAGRTKLLLGDKAGIRRLLERAKRSGFEPRKVYRPRMAAIRKLTAEIAALPRSQRLTVEQVEIYTKTVEQLYRRQKRLETLVARCLVRQNQIQHRIKMTGALTSSYREERALRYLLDRKGANGANLHASALVRGALLSGKRTSAMCSEWGRNGALARWGERTSGASTND